MKSNSLYIAEKKLLGKCRLRDNSISPFDEMLDKKLFPPPNKAPYSKG